MLAPIRRASMYWRSPSSRRAWVEIFELFLADQRAEQSPSSRRAWVEMPVGNGVKDDLAVALLAEGVGRNFAGQGPRHF